MSLDARRDAANRAAMLVDALSGRFARELAESLKVLKGRIAEFVRQFDAEGGQIVRTQVNLARALALKDQIEAALAEAGYVDLVTRASDAPLDKMARLVLETRGGAAAAKLSAYQSEALAAMKSLRLADLLEVGDDLAASLWRTTLDGVLGAQSRATLIEDLSDLMDDTEAHARTLYDTAVSTYTRQVHLLGSDGSPDERFIYLGPNDEVTRPFCRAHLNETLTRAEIEALDNGQLPNPLLTGGGYNCRHVWNPVGLEAAA